MGVIVVMDGLFLDRILCRLQIERLIAAGERKDADLQCVQRAAGVAVADVGQEVERFRLHFDLLVTQAALAVVQRPVEQGEDVGLVERPELEDLAAADQRRNQRKERIGRRRPDETDDALFHVGQQHVLLGAVEAVQFVDEQEGPCPVGCQAVAGRVENCPHLLHAGRGGIQRSELAPGVTGDDLRQCRLAGARRAVEHDGTEPIGFEHPPQQLAFTHEVPLTDELLEVERPHAGRQRTGAFEVLRFLPVEQRHKKPPPGAVWAKNV